MSSESNQNKSLFFTPCGKVFNLLRLNLSYTLLKFHLVFKKACIDSLSSLDNSSVKIINSPILPRAFSIEVVVNNRLM